MSEEAFYVSLLLSSLFTLSNISEAIIFSYLMNRWNIIISKKLNINNIGLYSIVLILSALIGAIIGSVSVGIFYSFDAFVVTLLFWWIGSLMGILVFGTLIINSYFHDDNPYMILKPLFIILV